MGLKLRLKRRGRSLLRTARIAIQAPWELLTTGRPPQWPDEVTATPQEQGFPLGTSQQQLARLIAFYLPQFHPIPENDAWWGKDFTEWTNVKPAKPLFEGHYQPHEPGELGYYDLRDADVQHRQVELAKRYGIGGFCFYFYWFNGKRLLDLPIENYRQNTSLDLPYCLCWANESWSRRWDGKAHELLIDQQHSPDDDLAFIAHVAAHFHDPRYILIYGRPLLLVYRPGLLPDARATARRWRQWCVEAGIGEILLATTQSFEACDPASYGFDVAIEFPPNNFPVRDVRRQVRGLGPDFSGHLFDWTHFPRRADRFERQRLGYNLWRGVCPSWDNTARRKQAATVFCGSTPAGFRHWLRRAIVDTVQRRGDSSERLVFINAWNEWAEGAHLEPDRRYGYAWLEACRRALAESATELAVQRRLVLVLHDCHPHGAQYLALSLARCLKQQGFLLELIALEGGPLAEAFAAEATLHVVAGWSELRQVRLLDELQRRGCSAAITNTVVSGALLPLLKLRGFRVLSLIHELPGVIRSMGLDEQAQAIARGADLLVFPAALVRDRFMAAVGPLRPEQTLLRHQGLLRTNPYRHRRGEARQQVLERHGLPAGSRLVVAVGFLDERKGGDLLVEAAAWACAAEPNLVVLWVGHHERSMHARVQQAIRRHGLEERVLLTGFNADPLDYYAAAEVYALPSREDPFPNVVLEAIHVGVPVLAFAGATGTEPLLLAHGGRVVPAFDTTAYGEALVELLSPSGRKPRQLAAPPDQRPAPVGELSMERYSLDLCHALLETARISVVVPNYNYAALLPERLASIRRQSHPLYEWILLDDASSDGSAAVLQDFLERYELPGELLVNAENAGSVFRQWRRGVERASGDLIWIAEADDSAEPGLLDALVEAFADPGVVMAYCESQQVGPEGQQLADSYRAYTEPLGQHWLHDHVVSGAVEIGRALCVKNTIPNVSACLFRREPLLQALTAVEDELERLQVAGDWRLYLELLGKARLPERRLAFKAASLNRHRRHDKSVTQTLARQRHYNEVVAMQELAATLADNLGQPLTEEIRTAQQQYRGWLQQHFALPTSAASGG